MIYLLSYFFIFFFIFLHTKHIIIIFCNIHVWLSKSKHFGKLKEIIFSLNNHTSLHIQRSRDSDASLWIPKEQINPAIKCICNSIYCILLVRRNQTAGFHSSHLLCKIATFLFACSLIVLCALRAFQGLLFPLGYGSLFTADIDCKEFLFKNKLFHPQYLLLVSPLNLLYTKSYYVQVYLAAV